MVSSQNAANFYRALLYTYPAEFRHEYGAGTHLPLTGQESLAFFELKGRGRLHEMIESRTITPGYLEAMDVALLQGRRGNSSDLVAKTPPLLINNAFANRFLRGRSPLAQQIRLAAEDGRQPRPWAAVIGVVQDMHQLKMEDAAAPQIFQIAWPNYNPGVSVALQTSPPPATLIPEIRNALRELDPALAIENVETMGQRIAATNARRTFQTALLTGFAGIAEVSQTGSGRRE